MQTSRPSRDELAFSMLSRSPGLAQINALGNSSGFVFNFMIGWLKDETGSFPLALMPIAAIGAICELAMGRNHAHWCCAEVNKASLGMWIRADRIRRHRIDGKIKIGAPTHRE